MTHPDARALETQGRLFDQIPTERAGNQRTGYREREEGPGRHGRVIPDQ